MDGKRGERGEGDYKEENDEESNLGSWKMLVRERGERVCMYVCMCVHMLVCLGLMEINLCGEIEPF